jgi:predicted phage terminase large subunit-like protein
VIETWLQMRQRARTDLIWLCNEVLGYPDVCQRVHGPVIDALQKFQGGTDELIGKKIFDDGKFAYTKIEYKPALEFSELACDSQNLILIPRDHLKSTVATMAHTIQWIINYPNIRVLVSTATGDQATAFVRGIKTHFIANEKFRFLFPDFCPAIKKSGKVEEWGTQDGFEVPNKTSNNKEKTITTTTVGAVVASGHYDVIKDDDIVDKENVRTSTEIQRVISHFGMLWPLLQRFAGEKKGWRDVVGTRYDFSDLYGVILDAEENLKPEDRTWKVCVISAAPNWPNGPFLWPERYGYSALKAIENDPTQGPAVLASQYLMNPIPAKSGLITSEDQIVWMPRKVIDELYAFLRLRVTIDVADLDPATLKGSDTDYTVLNLHGFGHDGTLYILEVNQGRFDGQEVINLIFDLYKRHPRIIEFKIEEEAHSRVLGPFLYREQARKNIWLPITKIKRDNKTSKQQRIRGLQPLFIAKRIKFAEDLVCKTNLKLEIMRFPKYKHDDILDTCADALHNADGSFVSDLLPSENAGSPRAGHTDNGNIRTYYNPQAKGFDKIMQMIEQHEEELNTRDSMTGW